MSPTERPDSKLPVTGEVGSEGGDHPVPHLKG